MRVKNFGRCLVAKHKKREPKGSLFFLIYFTCEIEIPQLDNTRACSRACHLQTILK